jgi:thiol-disulfide isomerase/thioredoxin
MNRLTVSPMIVAMFFAAGCASPKLTLEDGDAKEKMILGKCSIQSWKQSADWATYDAPDYAPDGEAVNVIRQNLQSESITLLLFGGSWCGDTKAEFPKYFKLFQALGISEQKLSLYGVSRNKKEPSNAAEQYKIVRVPTFIALKDGKEIGRITEYPKESIEKDIAKFFQEKK